MLGLAIIGGLLIALLAIVAALVMVCGVTIEWEITRK